MKNNFKWHKEQIGGKWYSVCDHKHVPMIEHTKDGKYKLRNANGKAVLHEDFGNAVKLALEVYEKFKKFNKSFEEQTFEKVRKKMEHPKDENFLGVFFMRDVLCHKCCGIMRDEEGEFWGKFV